MPQPPVIKVVGEWAIPQIPTAEFTYAISPSDLTWEDYIVGSDVTLTSLAEDPDPNDPFGITGWATGIKVTDFGTPEYVDTYDNCQWLSNQISGDVGAVEPNTWIGGDEHLDHDECFVYCYPNEHSCFDSLTINYPPLDSNGTIIEQDGTYNYTVTHMARTAEHNQYANSQQTLGLAWDFIEPPPIVTRDVDYINDWNLVSLPLDVSDKRYSAVFPESIDGTLFEFDGAYFNAEELAIGEGYWLRFIEDGATTIEGECIDNLTVQLSYGWNLIGSLTFPISISDVLDPDEIIVPGSLYGFDGTYISTSIIEPGKGYWIRTNQSGDVTLSGDASGWVCDGDIDECTQHSDCNTGEFCHSGWNGTYTGMRECVTYTPDYCADNPCIVGDGNCDSDAQCDDGSVCFQNHYWQLYEPGSWPPDFYDTHDPGNCDFGNNITVNADCCLDPVEIKEGCTNEDSWNYDSRAGIDDGSCLSDVLEDNELYLNWYGGYDFEAPTMHPGGSDVKPWTGTFQPDGGEGDNYLEATTEEHYDLGPEGAGTYSLKFVNAEGTATYNENTSSWIYTKPWHRPTGSDYPDNVGWYGYPDESIDGTTWTFTAYCKTVGPSTSVILYLFALAADYNWSAGSAGSPGGFSYSTFTCTNEWKPFSHTHTVDWADARFISGRVDVKGSDDAVIVTYWDTMSLIEYIDRPYWKDTTIDAVSNQITGHDWGEGNPKGFTAWTGEEFDIWLEAEIGRAHV